MSTYLIINIFGFEELTVHFDGAFCQFGNLTRNHDSCGLLLKNGTWLLIFLFLRFMDATMLLNSACLGLRDLSRNINCPRLRIVYCPFHLVSLLLRLHNFSISGVAEDNNAVTQSSFERIVPNSTF